MGIFNSIVVIVFAVIILFSMYRFLKHNPEAISSKNINKSFYTMGIVALILIGFIGLVVMIL